MKVRVIQGDCLEVMPTLDAESIDAIVCDPPYGLGFMGKAWDHGVPGVPFWIEAIRVAKPGAYLLAFGGTRTFHRLTVAIEDAGWEIRDCLSWLYGSGFPKSLDVGKAIDKCAGTVGTFGAPKSEAHAGWIERGRMRGGHGHEGLQRPWMNDEAAVDRNAREYAPATSLAQRYKGWGTALKPAWEPIIMARKPLKQTVAVNVQEHGTGALNIDACRISVDASDPNHRSGITETTAARSSLFGIASQRRGSIGAGRWPANVCLDEEAAAMLDEQSGEAGSTGSTNKLGGCEFFMGGERRASATARLNDTGGASRFFYTAKAARSERNDGLEGCAERKVHGPSGDGRVWDIPGSKSTARANHHPTVKPVDLMRWLVRLVTPPNGVVLDPFMGSGTTGIAAVLESKRFIGIEKEAEYCAIAEKRIAHWGAQGILNLDGVA